MSKPFEYVGEIHQIRPVQQFPSGFYKQTIICVTDKDSKYPNYAAFEFFKEKCAKLSSLRKGSQIKVKFYLQANQSKRDPNSWFSSCNGFDVELIGGSDAEIPASSRQTKPVPHPAVPPSDMDESAQTDEEMPF